MDSNVSSSFPYRTAALLLILATTVARILYLAFWCPLDLAADEAHYWDWSRHLDWSYYSKGPLVALLIRISCWLFGDLSLTLTGTQMLAVRLPAVLCGALLLWAIYQLTVEAHGEPRWGLATVALALTMPLIMAGSLIMTIDAPYTCAWAWALVWVQRALFSGNAARTGHWLLAGLCVATGVLAKHTMVLFVPMVGLFLLTRWIGRRRCADRTATDPMGRTRNEDAEWRLSGELARPGFWIMAGIGALGGLPILFWNMQNGWVTLAHTRGHVGLREGPTIHLLGPFNFIGLQAALLLGYWFIVWAGAMWRYRPGQQPNARHAYLWWMSAPMFAFFALFSLKNGGGEPNWPITAYLAGLGLMAPWLAAALSSPRPIMRRATLGFMLLFAALGLALCTALLDSRLVRPLLARLGGRPNEHEPTPMRRFDPTCRLKGWRTLAHEVDALRATLRRQGEDPIIAAGHWTLPGQIGFYGQEQPEVYCLGAALGDRHSQYDLWRPNPIADVARYLGRTFILVGIAESQVGDAFDRVDTGRFVVHTEGGQPLALWYVTVGHGFRGLRARENERY